MINVNDINSISLLLSSTFFYGFDRQISEDVIEARIIKNKYIKSKTLINKNVQKKQQKEFDNKHRRI